MEGLRTMQPVIDLPDDLGFTADHELLRATARRVLARSCPMTEVRRLAGDPSGFDSRLYLALAEQGWPGMLMAEEHDGAGMDYLSMAILLEETGRCLLPAPLWSTVMAGIAIELAGSAEQKRRWLPDLTTGERVATVAFTEPGGSWAPEAVAARARRTAKGYELQGVKNHVLWARSADVVIAPFVLEDGALAMFAIELSGPLPGHMAGREGLVIDDEVSVDPTRRMARMSLDRVVVEPEARLEAGDLAAWRAVHVRGYALLAAEMLGAAEAMLGRTRDYAAERIQFGRPIGAFQAVKHPLVNVLIAVEQARSLVVGAAAALDAPGQAALDAPGQAEILARMAKASATEALSFAADRGVQLHGGYGFTWDCDAHFFFKRALWSAATLGDATHHRGHLGSHLCEHMYRQASTR
jgi:alkylation response protein AidB-like acyl-CoA dehydrogenase